MRRDLGRDSWPVLCPRVVSVVASYLISPKGNPRAGSSRLRDGLVTQVWQSHVVRLLVRQALLKLNLRDSSDLIMVWSTPDFVR